MPKQSKSLKEQILDARKLEDLLPNWQYHSKMYNRYIGYGFTKLNAIKQANLLTLQRHRRLQNAK